MIGLITQLKISLRQISARMFGDTRPTVQGKTLPLTGQIVTTMASKDLPREIPPVARRLFPAFDKVEIVDRNTVRIVNATPDVTIEGRMSSAGAGMVSELEAHLGRSGLATIPPDVGRTKLAEELGSGRKGDVEVIVSGGLGDLGGADDAGRSEG